MGRPEAVDQHELGYMKFNDRPTWQLPPGVSRGTWDYFSTPSIATEYDSFHGDHPLMHLDQQWIAARLESLSDSNDPRVLLDLGCGTGRAILPWSKRGWRTLGVDLSFEMLKQVQAKGIDNDIQPGLVHANLAQLSCIADCFADAAICLYSSIGMIRGYENRHAMLQAVYNALKVNGLFFVHVHNRGSWLRDPRGIRTTLQSYVRSRFDKESEFGDRIYPYRGLPSMFLHIFSQNEIERALRRARFKIESVYLLNRTSSGPLRWKWFLPHLRAGGFMVTALKSRIDP